MQTCRVFAQTVTIHGMLNLAIPKTYRADNVSILEYNNIITMKICFLHLDVDSVWNIIKSVILTKLICISLSLSIEVGIKVVYIRDL